MTDGMRAAVVIAASVGVAGGVAAAVAPGTTALGGVAVPVLVAAVALGVNLVAFVPAARLESERFYDLTGSLTYVAVVALAVGAAAAAGTLDGPSVAVAGAVLVWALRLGLFLFGRIRRAGKDGRFDAMKRVPARFIVAWVLQGLWVFLTALAATTFIALRERPSGVTATMVAGMGLWAAGFAIEVVADRQKARFAADPANRGRFIASGLWAWSRHPNYFGEIVLWTGLFVFGAEVWRGAQWLTALSPLFVAFLLLRVSGIPLLEERADARWGHEAAYQAYRARTPVLVPRPPRPPPAARPPA